MGPVHRRLYGFGAPRLAPPAARLMLAAAASKLPLDAAIPQVREYVDTHAFGARRRAVPPDPLAAAPQQAD